MGQATRTPPVQCVEDRLVTRVGQQGVAQSVIVSASPDCPLTSP
jgi:hypothetical protein